MKNMPRHRLDQGVVLLTTLLTLVVMLIGAVALIRSFDTSLTTAGNLSFKRDVAQQSELAVQNILTSFRVAGPLANRAARADHDASRNYRAAVLPTNAQGIPLALLTDDLLDEIGTAADIDAGRGITLRYLVDRQCSEVGDDILLGAERCTLSEGREIKGGSSSLWERAELRSGVAVGGAGSGLAGAVQPPVVYRVSIRATGPRGTQSFFQTTFSCCEN